MLEKADWYLAAPGVFERLGSGDLSLEDLKAVAAEMERRYGKAGFVAVARRREIEKVLSNSWGTKRITWSERLNRPIAPRLSDVARGARLACIPEGVFFVDEEHFFSEGEQAPFPWTDPPVSLPVMRPRRLRQRLRELVGKKGPRRARLS